MLIFCFSVNVAVCDVVRFDFFVSVAQKIGCVQGVNWVFVQLLCVCVCVCDICIAQFMYMDL